jgi:Family of unknown function (DUF6090)
MIKFFRKIRYDLMGKNKTGKYLKYAVGEIILVVIGILIALQINNWNEKRKENALEKELINLLISDLEEKKRENLSDFTNVNRFIERFQETVEMWQNQKMIDTSNLKGNLGILGGDDYFLNQNSPIYSGLSSNDFWKQLPDSLNKRIDDIYRIRLKRIGIAFDKSNEYGTFCRLNFLTPNDLMDLDRPMDVILKKVEPVKEQYILNSKLFIIGAKRLRGRVSASANEIENLIKSLRQYNEFK